MPLFHARGVFQYSFGLMPYRKPINTIGTTPAAPLMWSSSQMSQPLSLCLSQWGSLFRLSRLPVQPVRTLRNCIKCTCRVLQSCLRSTNTNMALKSTSTSPSYESMKPEHSWNHHLHLTLNWTAGRAQPFDLCWNRGNRAHRSEEEMSWIILVKRVISWEKATECSVSLKIARNAVSLATWCKKWIAFPKTQQHHGHR